MCTWLAGLFQTPLATSILNLPCDETDETKYCSLTVLPTLSHKMSAKYERLPTSPTAHSRSNSLSHSRSPSPTIFPPKRSASRVRLEAELNRELQRQTERDPRFNTPAPAAWKRIALLAFIGMLLWLSFWVRAQNANAKNKVVHANR